MPHTTSQAESTHHPNALRMISLILALMLTYGPLGACATSNMSGSSDLTGNSTGEENDIGVQESASSNAATGYPPPFDDYPAYPYAPLDGEGYADVDEPGFMATSIRPLSTLAADVDTASYSNLRRMVRDGAQANDIPSGAVRTEEMLNYFDYDYATPKGGDLFGVTTQIGDCPWNADTKLLVMGFATQPADYAASAGSNLVFLIDTSGSMNAPDKLPLLKDAFATLVDGLSERDHVSIVTYAGVERVVLEGASGADKRRILQAIDSLQASGATNGEAGLETAYHIAERSFIEGGVNRIVMASDGDLNVGISSERDLHDFVDGKRTTGVYLSVLGFGSGNYQDTKMETLADHGNGAYHYIDCIEEAENVFGTDLNANLVPLADDVKIQVEFNPAQVKGYRLIGYENRALADEAFEDDTADAGDVGAGHAFTVAYEIVPIDSAFDVYEPDLTYGRESAEDTTGSDDAWLTCSMRYHPAGSSETVEQTHVVEAEDATRPPSDDWMFAAAVIECSMVLRQSPYAGTATLDAAADLLSDIDLDRKQEGFVDLLRRL